MSGRNYGRHIIRLLIQNFIINLKALCVSSTDFPALVNYIFPSTWPNISQHSVPCNSLYLRGRRIREVCHDQFPCPCFYWVTQHINAIAHADAMCPQRIDPLCIAEHQVRSPAFCLVYHGDANVFYLF